MTRIRAAVCNRFGSPLEIETLELDPPGPGEVEVELGACAICHSDIAYADGIWGGTLPQVFGHEAAGRITATGGATGDLEVGARVIVTLIRACGYCPDCAAGHPVACAAPGGPAPLRRPDGSGVRQGMNCGAFAERVVVHRSQVARIPDAMPWEEACLLSCGVITGVGAVVHSGRLRAGEDAVIIGAGGVGLNAIQGARLAGARRIVAVDLSEEKLADARAFGATDGILASDPSPWERLRGITGRGADAVFVTTGALAAFEAAPRYLASRGRVILVGLPAVGAIAGYEAVELAGGGQCIAGSKMGDTVLARDIPWLVDLWAQRRLDLGALISGRWRLSQINEAIADTRAGRARRNVILFGDQSTASSQSKST